MVRMTEKERIQWCYSFNSSKRWLTAVHADLSGSTHTEKDYCKGLYLFCKWISKNPDELIAERKKQVRNEETEKKMEDRVRSFCVWLEKERKIRRSTIATKYHAPIRSFFRYNDLPLRLRTPKHATRQREPHSVEEIKALLQIADIRERAIIMLLKDSGISREDVVTLKYRNIKDQYESGKEFIHIKTTRQKESVEYSTFLGKNAVEALRAYLEYRKRKGEQITEDSHLLATLNGSAMTADNLSQIFVRLSRKIGFPTSPHRFRKFFESHLGLAVPSILVKFWLGHTLGTESAYFLPPVEKQREKYVEGYREIDLYKSELSELDLRKRLLIDQIMLLKPDVDRKGLENILAKVRTNEELSELILSRRLEQAKKCEDDGCQKIVEESTLQEYIEKGWKFVATLPSGKVVVSNE